MKNSIPLTFSAFVLSLVCAGSLASARYTFAATLSAADVSQAGPQATPTPAKTRTRVRRAGQRSESRTVAKPPAAATGSSVQKASDTSAEQVEPKSQPAHVSAPAAVPPVQAEVEPAVEAKSEEVPPTPKVEPVLTPEERLRQQLQVVEQMIAKGLKQEAIAELRLLSAEDRFDPQGFYNIANAFARLEATDAAINTYRKAIEQRKGHYSRASNNLGVVLLRQGFWDQAYEAFLAALRAENFHYAEASYNLGRLYAARGEMDRAAQEWRRAITVDPNHKAATRALDGKQSFSISPVGPRPLVTPASKGPDVIGAGREKSSPVAATAKRPLTLDPETYAFLKRARTAHESARYEEAVLSFRRVIQRMHGYFSPANLELGYSLMELGRHDEAIAALLPVAQKDGARLPISYYHLGRLYEMKGDLPQAENFYARAVQSYREENPQFLLNLSGVREKRGDFSGALSALQDYVSRKEKQGQKPDWADARLASLRGKVASAQTPAKQ